MSVQKGTEVRNYVERSVVTNCTLLLISGDRQVNNVCARACGGGVDERATREGGCEKPQVILNLRPLQRLNSSA